VESAAQHVAFSNNRDARVWNLFQKGTFGTFGLHLDVNLFDLERLTRAPPSSFLSCAAEPEQIGRRRPSVCKSYVTPVIYQRPDAASINAQRVNPLYR
jgi:hypothetical protein